MQFECDRDEGEMSVESKARRLVLEGESHDIPDYLLPEPLPLSV